MKIINDEISKLLMKTDLKKEILYEKLQVFPNQEINDTTYHPHNFFLHCYLHISMEKKS